MRMLSWDEAVGFVGSYYVYVLYHERTWMLVGQSSV